MPSSVLSKAALAGGVAALCVALLLALRLLQPDPETPPPPAQQAFTAAVVQGQEGMDQHPNELKRRQLRRLRDAAVCAAVPDRLVSDWRGRVGEIALDRDGQATLSVELDHGIRFATHDDAGDDEQAHTLLPEGSPVYQALIDLAEGDEVRFSGELLPGGDGCLDERSATFSGAMSSPSWLMRFTSIAPDA